MKGNSAMPAAPSKSKQTRFSTLWGSDRVGFLFSEVWAWPRDAEVLPEEES